MPSKYDLSAASDWAAAGIEVPRAIATAHAAATTVGETRDRVNMVELPC